MFALFVFLPLHSDPSLPIILAALSGIFAAGGFPVPAGLPRYALIAFLGYALIAFAASVRSPEALSSFAIVLLWACAACAGILFSRLHPDHRYPFLLGTALAILLSLGAAAALGFDAPRFWHGQRLKLFAIHPSRLGLYCTAALLFCLHGAAMAPRPWKKALLLALTIAMAACLYLTNTRGLILVLPLGILCLVPALPAPRRKPLLTVFLAALALGAAGLWITKDAPLSKRVVSVVTSPTEDPTFRTRIPIWEAAWESFKEAPLIGHGVKQYTRLHKEYLAAHKAEWDEKYAGRYESSAKNAHSIILGRLVESGACGALCFVIFYAAAVVAAFRLPPEQRWVAAFLVFYMGVGVFDDTIFRRNDAFVFFLAGTALGFPRGMGKKTVCGS